MKFEHEPGNLLVVDDNKVNRILLSRGLEQYGHTIETAENGKQALEMLKRGSYDLVLLDIEMPEMNGYQVLEACLQDDELRNLPIIMTSSLDEIDSVVKCVELGAEDYLNKPVNPVLLRARVNASLEKKRLRDEQRKLIRTFTTKEVADELLRTGFSLGGKFVNASVMFTDIRSFTTLTESSSPAEIIDMLNGYYALMFEAITSQGGSVNQIIGDGLMAIFGAPIQYEDHCQRAVKAAVEMLELLEGFNQTRSAGDRPRLRIGIGIASGRMIAGFTGTQHRATYTCVGDPVNLASRLEAETKVIGRPILIDGNTRAALGEAFQVESHGLMQLRGKTVDIEVFSVSPGQSADKVSG
jgi:adenylate cyclase